MIDAIFIAWYINRLAYMPTYWTISTTVVTQYMQRLLLVSHWV